jgi:hypothetical protein
MGHKGGASELLDVSDSSVTYTLVNGLGFCETRTLRRAPYTGGPFIILRLVSRGGGGSRAQQPRRASEGRMFALEVTVHTTQLLAETQKGIAKLQN